MVHQNTLRASLVVGFVLVVSGYILRGTAAVPNGELSASYSLDTCLNSSASFSVSSVIWQVYTLRPVVANELPSTACPAIAAPSGTLDITLEADDGNGYRMDAKYFPTFFLPTGTYALLDFEVVDAKGESVLPLETIQLGPNQAYPWAVDASGSSSVGRRMLFAAHGAADDGASLWLDEEAEEGGAAAVAPGGRRLLKGGGLFGGASSSGTGGRSSSSGAGRWGSSAPSTRSYSSSSTYRSSSGVSYGGHSTYYVGGSSYYTGTRPYSYRYGSASVRSNTQIIIIGRSHYGCYSCYGAYRTCYSCNTCRSRSACAHETSRTVTSSLDRYEMSSFYFKTASSGLGSFPLTLKVSSLSLFSKSAIQSGLSVYTTFTTADGDAWDSAISIMLTAGWVLIFATTLYSFFCRKNITSARRSTMAERRRPPVRVVQPPKEQILLAPAAPRPVATSEIGLSACANQLRGDYGQPAAAPLPVARIVAAPPARCAGYPQAGGGAYPQADACAYPQAGGGAYPTAAAYPPAAAYPTPPASPPSASTKEE